MKQTKHIALAMTICMSLLLTGCFPTGEISTPFEETPEDIESAIMQIDAENENLIIDLDFPEYVPEKVERLKVRWKSWDFERPVGLFVRVVEGLELDEDGVYRSETGALVFYDDMGRLWVEAGEPYKSYYYFSLSEGARGVYPLEDYFTDESISLLARGDALEKAKKTLSDAGINSLGEPLVYALTADKANAYLNEKYGGRVDKDGNEIVVPTWTAAEEAYVMEFGMELNGIPISRYSVPGSLSGNSWETSPTTITMVIGKDYFPLIWCEGVIDEEYEAVGEAAISVSPQSALRTVIERYEGLSIPNQITKICGCRLVYAPSEQADDNTFILNPFWEFDIRYDRGRGPETISSTYVNAQTGMGV